jgi:hydrogenase expression/formation protein HypE
VQSPGDEQRLLGAGKIPLELLTRLLAELPPPPPELRLGARVGEDACAFEVSGGVVVAATDPITLTSEEAGRLAVLVNANDVAVCGATPRWFLSVVLVPPDSTHALVEGLFRSIRLALQEIGAYLVGGHTEVTPAVTRPVVVGQMLGTAEGAVVTTGGFERGELIEGASVLAREASGLDELEPALLAAARSALERPGVSVVEPALLARNLGATALHDPTEGGLAAGLHEMAAAAGHRIVVDREAVLWFSPGVAVCRALGANPWNTLASGTLLATFPAAVVQDALAALAEQGHPAALIGRVEDGNGVEDENSEPIAWAEQDEVARLLSAGEADDHRGTI